MRHANLPLQVLAPSVAFAPQCSTARFLWREISASATAGVAPLVHSPGTCCALAARKALRQRMLAHPAGLLRCPPAFSLDPQPLRQGVGIAGWSRARSDAADTRGDAPILQRGQPDGAGRIMARCDRDGSRAPHRCITGGLHPRTHVRLSSFAWPRQGMPPECRQNPPAPPVQATGPQGHRAT